MAQQADRHEGSFSEEAIDLLGAEQPDAGTVRWFSLFHPPASRVGRLPDPRRHIPSLY